MTRDRGTVYMEEQAREERREASLDNLLRRTPPPTAYQCLVDNAWALLAVCERAAAGFEFVPEYDPETGDLLPPADQTITHEVAREMDAVVRAAKGGL